MDWSIKTADEACSPCPWCGGEDRFVIWSHGRYLCRPAPGHCGREGWLDEEQQHTWSKEEIRLRRIEAEQVRARRERVELAQRLTALEQMARCTDHVDYHERAVKDERFWEWATAQGLMAHTIYDYQIGMCPRCPTDLEHRPSYTFPIWRKDGPLWSIRHRLVDAENGDKYRPHRAGLGRQLVNARYLADWTERVVVVEGAKKARVVGQYDIPTVGVLGKMGFETRWLAWFPRSAAIYLALDPDASDTAERLGHDMVQAGRKEVYVASLPDKPDDMILKGNVEDLENFLRYARRAR